MKAHPYTSTPTKFWINSVDLYDFLSLSDLINKHIYVLLHYPSIQIVRKGRNKQQEVGLKICFRKLLLFHTTYLYSSLQDFRLVYKYRWNNTKLFNTILYYYWIFKCSTTSIQFCPKIILRFSFIFYIEKKSKQGKKNIFNYSAWLQCICI